jgi:hypothetical protein
MHSSSCFLNLLYNSDRLTEQLRDSSRAANHLCILLGSYFLLVEKFMNIPILTSLVDCAMPISEVEDRIAGFVVDVRVQLRRG